MTLQYEGMQELYKVQDSNQTSTGLSNIVLGADGYKILVTISFQFAFMYNDSKYKG